MLKKKRRIAVLLVLVLVFATFGCSRQEEAPSATTEESASESSAETPSESVAPTESEEADAGADAGDGYTIGFLMMHQLDDFMQSIASAAEAYAPEAGVELILQSPQKHAEVEKQIELADDMITKKVDALILDPIDGAAMVPSVVKANEAGIPVIIIDGPLDEDAVTSQGAEYVTFVGTDNFAAAQLGGEFIAEQYPDGAKIAMLTGTVGHSIGDKRIAGFYEGIAGNEALDVVSEQPTDWTSDQGYTVMQNVLTANPDIEVVYCCSGLIALGAVEAIQQAGLGDQIQVLGYDGSKEEQEKILEGQMLGTIAQSPTEIAEKSIDAAIAYLKGESVEPIINTKTEVMTKESLGG